jgi:hypothetical protein
MFFQQSDLIDEAIKHKKNMIALCREEGIVITKDVSKALDLSAESYAAQVLQKRKYHDMLKATIERVKNIYR